MAVLGASAAVALLLVACGRTSAASGPGGDRRAARGAGHDELGGSPGAAAASGTRPVGAQGDGTDGADGKAGPALVRTVDWKDVTYLSACGMSRVRVQGGVGEATSVGPYYGIEVVDVAYADVDSDGVEDAVVLLDCLGGDSYQPHVLVVPASGVMGPKADAVAPCSGGSFDTRHRPRSVSAEAGGTIRVTDDENGRRVEHVLHYAPAVLFGGELTAAAGSVIDGVLAGFDGTTATISVAPDDGYRLAVGPGTPAPDPATSVARDLGSLRGAAVRVTVGAEGTIATVEAKAAAGGA